MRLLYFGCMNELIIALVQEDLVWENPEANRSRISRRLDSLGHVDVVVLPEMFSTGFSMNPEGLSENMDGPTVEWMKRMAKESQAVITGSLIIEEDGAFFNRLIWAEPDGVLKYYDKRHRFSYAGEDEHYTAGKLRPTWEYKGWKIRPQVCYDLRFPVWSRNDDDYDLLLYVANWPERRSYPWKTLLKARAIENMSFVIGVNRTGEDGNGIAYSGDSAVISPLGEPIAQAEPGAGVLIQKISKSELIEVRERFQFLADRDDFRVIE